MQSRGLEASCEGKYLLRLAPRGILVYLGDVSSKNQLAEIPSGQLIFVIDDYFVGPSRHIVALASCGLCWFSHMPDSVLRGFTEI